MGAGEDRDMKLGDETKESLEFSRSWVIVSSPDLDTGGGVLIKFAVPGNLGFFFVLCFNFSFL